MFSRKYTPEKHRGIISEILNAGLRLGELVEVRLKYNLRALEIGNTGIDKEGTVYVDLNSVAENTAPDELRGLLEDAYRTQIGEPWFSLKWAGLNLANRISKDDLKTILASQKNGGQ